MSDDLTTLTAAECHNASKEVSNITSSSTYLIYYDEIITRLQLQTQQQQYHHKLEQPQHDIRLRTSNRKKRILLVDDEADHCLTYQIVLQDAGYECISYTDSVQALQEFRPDYYDLVILDIKMPKLDGFALCEKIREIDNAVQIIFITAGEVYYENFRRQYYSKLSNDVNIKCLQKPIGNEELIQIVNEIMAIRDTR
jgi:two-component system catabolic regulation response regulator CreB/two-component system response regulator ChvI